MTRPATLQHISDGNATSTHGHETRPLFSIATILVGRREVREALAFHDNQRLPIGCLNQKVADIQVRRCVRDTEGREGRSKATFPCIKNQRDGHGFDLAPPLLL
jgi:hypothetical protein